jgi:RNA polymerase sigma factor (TIGR02999 family)
VWNKPESAWVGNRRDDFLLRLETQIFRFHSPGFDDSALIVTCSRFAERLQSSAMGDATQLLNAIEHGDPKAAAELLPLVYDELRRLAAHTLTQEKPGQTLDATALVHEAYLRLVGDQQFANRRHFFAAAAQAMRRVLVESARRKQLAPRIALEGLEPAATADNPRFLELHDALERLATTEPMAAKVVEARVFAGLSVEEAAAALGLSRAGAYREWTFARAWLASVLADNSEKK